MPLGERNQCVRGSTSRAVTCKNSNMSESSNPDDPTVASSPYAAAERAKKARVSGGGASSVPQESPEDAVSRRPAEPFRPVVTAIVVSFCAALALGVSGIIAVVLYERGPCAASCPNGNCGTAGLGACHDGALVAPPVIPGLIAMALLAAVVVAGWPAAARLGNPRLARGVLLLVTVGSLCAAALNPKNLAFVAAAAVFLCFIAEMLRKDGRENLLKSVSATFLGSLLVIASGFWPVLLHSYEVGAVVLASICLLIGNLGRYVSASETSSKSTGILILRDFAYAFLGGAIYVLVTDLGFDTRILTWLTVVSLAFGLMAGLTDGALRGRVEMTKPAAAVFAVVPHCALGVIVYALTFAFS